VLKPPSGRKEIASIEIIAGCFPYPKGYQMEALTQLLIQSMLQIVREGLNGVHKSLTTSTEHARH
jgi:hypothetical protein